MPGWPRTPGLSQGSCGQQEQGGDASPVLGTAPSALSSSAFFFSQYSGSQTKKLPSQCFGESSLVSGEVKVCHVPYLVRMFQGWQSKVVIETRENFVVSGPPRVNQTTFPKPAEQELEESRKKGYRKTGPCLHLQCSDTFSPKPLLPGLG